MDRTCKRRGWAIGVVGVTLAGLVGTAWAAEPASDVKKTTDALKQTTKDAMDAMKAAPGAAADAAKEKAGAAGEAAMDDKMMAAWMEAAKPGVHHQHLAQFEGTWDAKTRIWMEPGSQPVESAGKMTAKMEFGGRYLYSHYQGDMMGQPFRGVGVIGYNNVTKEHENIWMDDMSTGMMRSSGTCDASGKTFTFKGEYVDPMGVKNTSREVWTVQGPDTFLFEMYNTGADGKEAKMMEIQYTRAAGGKAADTAKPAIPAGPHSTAPASKEPAK